RDVELKTFVDTAYSRLEIALELFETQARNTQSAHLGDKDLTVSVHGHFGVEIDLSPYSNEQLISRPNRIIGGHRNTIHRGKCGWNLVEQLPAVYPKPVP